MCVYGRWIIVSTVWVFQTNFSQKTFVFLLIHCSRKNLLVKYFYVIWQTSALSEWLFLKGYVKLRLFFCIDSFFWKGISKGLNMDLYLWERSYWVRTTTALSEREDTSIEHGLLLVKRMTLEAERIYEQKFRLKFGHLESELTRWRVWHSFIHSFIHSPCTLSFWTLSFILIKRRQIFHSMTSGCLW